MTRDGTDISLLANINRPYEARFVRLHHLHGVGLFRTEFMYLNRLEPPDVQTQLKTYQTANELLDGLPLVIRTLDLGGDKIPLFLTPHHEANPNLGLRGLRLSLAHRQLLETQLEAILQASRTGDVRVLFPMVLGGDDLAEGISVFQQVARRMGISDLPPVGAMIETPSALFTLEEILREADFVSIGTNDLTQFMLAADRDAVELLEEYSVIHPAVLRAIDRIVQAAQQANRPVCVCGEAAGYPLTSCLLVGMGVRQLSMSPLRAARIRTSIRAMRLDDAKDLAARALRASSTAAVRKLLVQFGDAIR